VKDGGGVTLPAGDRGELCIRGPQATGTARQPTINQLPPFFLAGISILNRRAREAVRH
jgi:hypothetical protein